MFIGEYLHTVDEKGRLFIPARLREDLGERFVVTRGLDECLFAFPRPEWDALAAKLRTVPFTRAAGRAFSRILFSGACECELDRQGRTLLPANLRSFAGLEKEAVIIGVSSRLEIWSKDRWEAYLRNAEVSYEDIAEKIGEGPGELDL
ncbi:MAG: division/cell wall cluster transcriptional repressor MraZ [Firmicutes bacterium]|nr:division/cell wall cluster transcriptional repressor MraZ [Bacillota bacterium]